MFPAFHIHAGLSGSTLLYEALRLQGRRTVVLPAFVCPDLPAAAAAAGTRVVLIDADRRSMHLDSGRLDDYLRSTDPADTILLFDHTFGNPFPFAASIRRRYPTLLIVEDAVRALGAQVAGEPIGCHSDWLLLSMYKTVPGSANGAVLLTRDPMELSCGSVVSASLREWVARNAACRWAYEWLKRRNSDYPPPRLVHDKPHWSPKRGLPSTLCTRRFVAELTDLEERRMGRQAVLDELRERFTSTPGFQAIDVPPECSPAAYFLSVLVESKSRDHLLAHLHRQGLFLLRTWDMVPSFYRSLDGAFPFGSAGSEYLARHILHIPIDPFGRRSRRDRLLRAVRDFCR